MEISGGSWKSMDMEMLIGGFNPSENMKVSWDDDIPNIWTNKTCAKPPIIALLLPTKMG